MSTVRLRRLGADYAKVQDYVRRHPRVRLIQAQGDPPERYQFEFRIRSLRMVNGDLQPVETHLVEVSLPLNYPRTPPQCRMLSPVFHPNIAPHAICVGDHWSAGEPLQSIITRIGEMLAYQSYNVKSPLNGEAARWVEENKHRIPLDTVSMLVEEDRNGEEHHERPATASAVPAPPSEIEMPPAPIAPSQNTSLQIECPQCRTSYRLDATLLGRKVRCKKCQGVFEVPAGSPRSAEA